MTIEEIKTEKTLLESKLSSLMNEFYDKTGCIPTVDLKCTEQRTGDGRRLFFFHTTIIVRI